MLFKPGVFAQSLSGTVGSSTFVIGKGGAYVRALGKGASNRSAAAVQQRGLFSVASTAWVAMTDDERKSWNLLAQRVFRVDRVGVKKNYSGRALFYREYLFWVGLFVGPPALLAPSNGVKTTFSYWAPTYDSALLQVGVLPYDGAANFTMVLYGCRSFSQGGFSRRNYKKFTQVQSSGAYVHDVTAAWVYNFGEPAIGEWISVQMRVEFENCLSTDPQRIDTRRTS